MRDQKGIGKERGPGVAASGQTVAEARKQQAERLRVKGKGGSRGRKRKATGTGVVESRTTRRTTASKAAYGPNGNGRKQKELPARTSKERASSGRNDKKVGGPADEEGNEGRFDAIRGLFRRGD